MRINSSIQIGNQNAAESNGSRTGRFGQAVQRLTHRLFGNALCSKSAIVASPPFETHSSAAHPFDELNLDPAALNKTTKQLLTQGYCSVAASEITQEFLKSVSEDDRDWSTGRERIPAKKIQDPELLIKMTFFMERLLSNLNGAPYPLQPNQFELRRPSGRNAAEWHKDNALNAVIVLYTLKGKGTEYVSLSTGSKFFKVSQYHPNVYVPIKGKLKPSYIQEANKGQFFIFLGKGMNNESVPKLIHRAPPEPGREIALLRWNNFINT